MLVSKELEKQVEPLLLEMETLVVICCYCRRYLGHVKTQGSPGGFSHGLCKPLCEKAKKNGWK